MSEATLNAESAERQMPQEVSEMSSPQPEVKERETGQNHFKLSDSNSMSTDTVKEKEKTEDVTGQMVEEENQEEEREEEEEEKEEEEEEKIKIQQDNPHLSVTENATDMRDHLLEQIGLVKVSLRTGMDEMRELDKTIEAKEDEIKVLELILARENYTFQKSLSEIEKKSTDAEALFEEESKIIEEKKAVRDKLTDEIGTLKSELTENEEILREYKRYKNILFKLSPLEWQEAQEARALKACVPSDRHAQDEQSKEPQDSAVRNSVEGGSESSPDRVLHLTTESTVPSAHDEALLTNSELDSDNSKYEERLELYFSDPQQLLDVMTELTEQNLSLIQNSARMDETLEELRQTTETTLKKIKEDEEQLAMQVNDLKDRLDKEKKRAATLKRRVQIHELLKTEDEDALLNTLDKKVTEVFHSCVDEQPSQLSTLEKLSRVEDCMFTLLEAIESIPREDLVALRQIKDSERKTRLREEELRLERERQKERMKKCMQRSLGDSKKVTGKKLMVRSIPVKQRTKVPEEDNIPAEDELHAYLFSTEDVE